MHQFSILLLVVTACNVRAMGDERVGGSLAIRTAIERGLRLVERSAANYPKHRRCFSCHNQTLPMLAMVAAREAGFAIDEALLKSQTEFTHHNFTKRIDELRRGEGIGGGAMTVGYGLWSLDVVKAVPDETTDAMVEYLLKKQRDDGHWKCSSNRPPLEESDITCTLMAIRFARKYARGDHREKTETITAKTKAWLASVKIESQEDLNSWVSGVALLGGSPEQIAPARERILAAQRDDGGFSQLPDMKSDAYATGQTLFVLRRMRMPASHPAIQRGIDYLLRTQHDDGSWFVETRSEPIQIFFDNGDPHGKSQFISITATGWAVTALSLVYTDDYSPARSK